MVSDHFIVSRFYGLLIGCLDLLVFIVTRHQRSDIDANITFCGTLSVMIKPKQETWCVEGQSWSVVSNEVGQVSLVRLETARNSNDREDGQFEPIVARRRDVIYPG